MQMFDTLNRQQQPFIRSGYGAMGKLNTLLGLGGGGGSMPAPTPNAPNVGNHMFRPTPGGGVQQMVGFSPEESQQPAQGGGNSRLRQLLALRAAHGDSEAARILGGV